MNANPIDLNLIAPYYMSTTAVYNIKNHLPARSLLMVQWVYDTHNDFLEDYIEFLEDDDWYIHTPYELRQEQRKAFEKQKAKNAKALKAMFPEVKQYNNLYDLIVQILTPVFVEQNE